jgi:hypothetical protein
MADGSDDWVEKAVQTDLQIYHYGFVRDPAIIAAKELRFQRMFVKRHGSLFPDPRVVEAAAANGERFYERFNDSLTFFPFEGTHPSPIRERVQTGVSWPTPWRTW